MNLREKAELMYRELEQQKDWVINVFEVFGTNKYAYLEKKVRDNRLKILQNDDFYVSRKQQKIVFESLL